MNSTTDTVNEESSSSSQINADKNANTNNGSDKSKGAIPKTKLVPKTSGTLNKKSVKINNNIDDLPTLNCVSNSSEILKRNGYSKCISNNFFTSHTCGSEDEKSCPQESHSDHHDYKFSCLNIPVENDYLNVAYLPFTTNTLLKDETQDELGTTCFNEEKVSFCSTDLYCAEKSWSQLGNKVDSDSSSDDNELLSVSDDGCIYTYKADNVADLPSSFFNFDLPPLENLDSLDVNRTCNSSPEMDFLEMDFDPGPSGDIDSDSTSNNDVETKSINISPLVKEAVLIEEPKGKDCNKLTTSEQTNVKQNNMQEQFSNIIKQVCVKNASVAPVFQSEKKMPWSCSLSERTHSTNQLRTIKRHHSSKGELVSPSECVPSSPNSDTICNLSSFHNAMGKILVEDKSTLDDTIDKIMIWTEQEACLKQVTQIAPSSCGATAVLNVLNALRIPLPTIEKIQEFVETRFRANSAPLTEYLISRSKAGCYHRDLISGLYKASDGKVYSRFFSMYPERVVNLYKWLGYWIKQGAVPIATLNLQKCHGKIPDSWHHQMIFGVGPKGIYLTNPMECVEASQLWPQLCSESVLLVRREDVLSRFNQKTDFPQLLKIDDVRWRDINVIGQTAKIIRESRRDARLGSTLTSHIKIPAEYRSGITLAIDMKFPAYSLLRQCPELPLLYPNNTANAFSENN